MYFLNKIKNFNFNFQTTKSNISREDRWVETKFEATGAKRGDHLQIDGTVEWGTQWDPQQCNSQTIHDSRRKIEWAKVASNHFFLLFFFILFF